MNQSLGTNSRASGEKPAFSPIFAARVRPTTIETKLDQKNRTYLLMRNATVSWSGKVRTRTVLCFAGNMASVEGMLVEGQEVELSIQFEGGSAKIIGPVRSSSGARS